MATRARAVVEPPKPVRRSATKKPTRSRRPTASIGLQAPLKLERPTWTTACPDWQERIVNGKTLTPCAPLFPTAAAQGMAVFDALKMVSAGILFGQVRPWVREFAASIFGAYCDVPGHPDEGRRLIQNFFMLISKKNGKSETAAAIMLTAIILNWRDEAEYIILSPTKEVADNSWKPLKAAIEADDDLKDLFIIKPTERTIVHRITNATLKVVAADTQTVVGKKATGVLVDELHEFGLQAKAEDMLVEATGGLASRPEGFVIYLTTQSADIPAGVFKKKLDYARMVRDGAVNDPSFMPIIYEFPPQYLDKATKPYLREENWHIVNPNLNASVDVEFLRNKFREAGISGEDSLQSVVSKHLNIQIGLDLGADRWPGADLWEEAANDGSMSAPTVLMTLMDRDPIPMGLRHLMSVSEVITAGADGGGLDDLLGLTFTGRLKGTTDRYLSWSRAWATDHVLKLRKEIAPKLLDFQKQGDLVLHETLGPDAKEAAELMKAVYDAGLLEAVGVDPARIASLLTAMKDAGLPVDDPKFLVKVRQGWSMASSIWWVERSLAEGRYKHMGQPVVNWAVGNAKVIPRGNALLVTKEVSGKAKIDVLMSSFNAAELMSYNPASRSGGYSLDKLTMMG